MNNFSRISIDEHRRPNIDSLINNLLTQMYLHTAQHSHLIISKSLIHGIGNEKFEDLHIMPDDEFDYGVWRSASSHGGSVIGVFSPPKQPYALESLAAFSEFSAQPQIQSANIKGVSWIDLKGLLGSSQKSSSSILIVSLPETKGLKNYDTEFVPETPYSMRDLISQVEGFVKKTANAAVAYPGHLDISLGEIGIHTRRLESIKFDSEYGWHPFHAVLEAIVLGVDMIVDYSMFPQVKLLRAVE